MAFSIAEDADVHVKFVQVSIQFLSIDHWTHIPSWLEKERMRKLMNPYSEDLTIAA